MFSLSLLAFLLLASNLGLYESALVCSSADEHHSDTVSACPRTCNNLHGVTCQAIILRESCVCNTGLVNDTVNKRCVAPENCPQVSLAEEPAIQGPALVCAAENEVYAASRSACPTTCQNRNVMMRCMAIIAEPSCVCVTGTIRDTVSGKCVETTGCPV